jgi:Zn-dependent protease with chaperone function
MHNLVLEEKEYLSVIHPKEWIYRTLSRIFAILFWIIFTIVTIGLGFIYVGIIALSFAIWHAIFLSYIKWYGIKITDRQFPEIYSLAADAAKKLWFEKVPAIYLYNMDGVFNAFATHFFSRNFIVVTTSILDACDNDLEKIRFILAHELTHLQRWHTREQFFLFPSRMVPWLANAYSRTCEYSCDGVAGKYILDNKKDALESILILPTADRKRATSINLDAYEEQRAESWTFWMTFTEIKSTHPFSFNRVAYMRSLFGESVPKIKKSIFAILIAPFMSIQLIIWLYIIGVLFAAMYPMMRWYMDRKSEVENQKIYSQDTFDIPTFAQ